MRRHLLTALLLTLANIAFAHEPAERAALVIDTDLGLDDAVTLAVALQSPHVDIVAIVAGAGAASREKSLGSLERLLALFNRPDIPLYAPVEGPAPSPPPAFREFAEVAVGRALSSVPGGGHRPFAAPAYGSTSNVTVLALGPLTNLAAALQAQPGLAERIEKIVIAGAPHPTRNWNLAYDAGAWTTVRASGLRLEFVCPDENTRKPAAWRHDALTIGQGTSIAERFLRRLLAEPRVREHYLAQWPGFSDELAFLYCAAPDLFAQRAGDERNVDGVFAPREGRALLDFFKSSVSDGRQTRPRVVLAAAALPETALQPDLRQRHAAIISKNGEVEWFAELLTGELHDHLGAYSVIGAKMGLWAAELLNAPPHALAITSHTAAGPPVSCLNDGLIVATGSTPGRGLFTHVPGAPGSTKVQFTYNGTVISLSVKPEYHDRIAADIGRLVAQYGLDRHEYWDGVRRLALDIWENWHRRDIFDLANSAALEVGEKTPPR